MKNKRGAPRGNKNALKHGFYARSFTSTEQSALTENVLGQFKDEIPLLRVLIARTAQSLTQEKNLSLEDELTALRTITLAVGRLESLTRSNQFYGSNPSEIEQEMEQAQSTLQQFLQETQETPHA